MRNTRVIGLWGALVFASSGLLAQETFNENAADKAEGREGAASEKGAPEPGGAVTRGSPDGDVSPRLRAGDPANRWRYKFHNGHWWYYGRSNQWSYWDGSAWTPYNRQAYGQWFNRRPEDANNDTYGRRPAGSIQREKNEARSRDFGDLGRRPPGTIQRQKNSPRGGED
jgi:hypothetical protein